MLSHENYPPPPRQLKFLFPVLLFIGLLVFFGLYLYFKPIDKALTINCDDVSHKIKRVTVSYYGFDGKVHTDGVIEVLAPAADAVKSIFSELLSIKFPLSRPRSVDDPDQHNATVGFSCREIREGSNRSLHSYGLAIDINPLQNPQIAIDMSVKKVTQVIPPEGVANLNRLLVRPGKPSRMGFVTPEVVAIFARHGFSEWGGYWDFPIDYMHFQLPRNMAVVLTAMSPVDSKRFFDMHAIVSNGLSPENVTTKNIASLMLEKYYPNGTIEDLVSLYQIGGADFFSKAQAIVDLSRNSYEERLK